MTNEADAAPKLAPKETGPVYPALATVAAHRRRAAAAGSIAAMDPVDRQAYGAAVLAGIRTLETARLRPPGAVEHRPNCASGTWESSPAAIQSAVRRQHAAQLQAAANADRRRRTDAQIIAQYESHMKAQRAAPVAAPAPVYVPTPAPPAMAQAPAPEPVQELQVTACRLQRPRKPRQTPAPAWRPFTPLRFERPALRAVRF